MRNPEQIENEKRTVWAEVVAADNGNKVAFHTLETEHEWVESDLVVMLEDVR